MPRPIIGGGDQSFQRPTQATDPLMARQLRGAAKQDRATPKAGLSLNTRRRSRAYIDAIAAFDAAHNQVAVDTDDLHRVIDEEFRPEIDLFPLGIVAKCYLGGAYEVHTLDPIGSIVEHYERGRALPAVLEKARRLAGHGSYLCVEVYSEWLVCVRLDGSTSEVR